MPSWFETMAVGSGGPVRFALLFVLLCVVPTAKCQSTGTQSHQLSLSTNAAYRTNWPNLQDAFVDSLSEVLSVPKSNVKVLRFHAIKDDLGTPYGTKVDFVLKKVPLSFLEAEKRLDMAKTDGSLLALLNEKRVHFSQIDPVPLYVSQDPYTLAVSIRIRTNSSTVDFEEVENGFKAALSKHLAIFPGAFSSINMFLSGSDTLVLQLRMTTEYLPGINPETLLSSIVTSASDGTLLKGMQDEGFKSLETLQVLSSDDWADSQFSRVALVPTDEEVAKMMGISVTDLRTKRAEQRADSFRVRVGDPRISVQSAGRTVTNIDIAL